MLTESLQVLQEVAAARHVLIVCRSAEIDGHTFCLGLDSKLASEDPATRNRIRSAAYLIKGATFRSKCATSRPGRFSLDIRPLGELMDMYHDRMATDRRDKVYALLGMSSDDDIPADLLPDYNISWKDLLHRLVRSLVGKQASVETWEEEEIAVIRSKGCVLGEVSWVKRSGVWNDGQNVDIIFKKKPGQKVEQRGHWAIHPTAKSIRKGDIVCLLEGTSKPTIIRLHEDYCTAIAIAVTPTDDKQWPGLLPSITSFPRDFLLVWDWEKSQETLEDGEDNGRLKDGEDYEHLKNSRLPEYAKADLKSSLGKAARLGNIGLILGDMEKHEEASRNLQKAISSHERPPGKELSHTLMVGDSLASMCRDRGDSVKAYKLEVMVDLFGRRGDFTQITEEKMIQVARALDQEVMALFLDQHYYEVKITEEVVKAAAGNEYNGMKVMALLLDRRGNEVKITEEVVKAAAGNKYNGIKVMALLLDRRGNEVKITEEVVKTVAGNSNCGKEVMTLLLDRRRNEVKITQEVVKATAGNEYCGMALMLELLDRRGNEIKITEEVVKAAAGNEYNGMELMELLLDRRGNEIKITEEVVKAAAGNEYSGMELMELLLNRRGDEIKITEEVTKAAAGNEFDGNLMMELLLDRRGTEVKITEKVVKAAVGNKDKNVEVMELLLDQRGEEVRAAGGNAWIR